MAVFANPIEPEDTGHGDARTPNELRSLRLYSDGSMVR